jgi:hypothetical protein
MLCKRLYIKAAFEPVDEDAVLVLQLQLTTTNHERRMTNDDAASLGDGGK